MHLREVDQSLEMHPKVLRARWRDSLHLPQLGNDRDAIDLIDGDPFQGPAMQFDQRHPSGSNLRRDRPTELLCVARIQDGQRWRGLAVLLDQRIEVFGQRVMRGRRLVAGREQCRLGILAEADPGACPRGCK